VTAEGGVRPGAVAAAAMTGGRGCAAGLPEVPADTASPHAQPPRGDLLPEPNNPFYTHVAATKQAANNKASAASLLAKKQAAAAARAAKAEKTARDRAAAGLPPLRRRPPRKPAPPRGAGSAAGALTGPTTLTVPPIPGSAAVSDAGTTPLTPPVVAHTTPPVVPPAPTPVVRPSPTHIVAGAPMPVDAALPERFVASSPTPLMAVLPRPRGAGAPTLGVAGALTPGVAGTATPSVAVASTSFEAGTSAPIVAGAQTPNVAAALTLNVAGGLTHAPAMERLAGEPGAANSAASTEPPVVTLAVPPAVTHGPSLVVAGALPPTVLNALTHAPAAAPLGGATLTVPPVTTPAPTPIAAGRHRARASSARPPTSAITLSPADPMSPAAAARAAAAAVLADADTSGGSAADATCNCSVARGVKRLMLKFDEVELASKKRRAATNLQLKELTKRQTASSAQVADVKRILSEVLKAVNCVGTVVGHGAAVTRELCHTVDRRGPGPALSVPAADSAVSVTGATLSPSLLDVPTKAPWAKDLVVSDAFPTSVLPCVPFSSCSLVDYRVVLSRLSGRMGGALPAFMELVLTCPFLSNSPLFQPACHLLFTMAGTNRGTFASR